MSVAFESNRCSNSNRIQGFSKKMWIYNNGGNPWKNKLPVVKEEEDSSSSSSIGKNSDAGAGDSDEEVQSNDNGPLSQLNALEEVLPIKRGLSTFYAGKSKSYDFLADAKSVQSIHDIVKPEDAYSRKRKNMIAHSILLEKHRKAKKENGLSNLFANSSLNSGHYIAGNGENSNAISSPPVHSSDSSSSSSSPSNFSPWRSLSLSDLDRASIITDSVMNEVDKEDKNQGLEDTD